MKSTIKNNNIDRIIWDYLLVFLLVATSGMMFFYSNIQYIVLGLLISSFIFFHRRKIEKIDRGFVLIFLLFITWEIFQSFYYQSYSIKQIIGTVIRFLLAYTVIKVAGKNFINSYINIILVLSIISLVFYSLFFIPQLRDLIISLALTEPLFPLESESYSFTPNFILVNFNGYQEFRNSGPFWEPGAFSVFLNIALLFNIIVRKKLFDKINIVLIITLVTTLSTAGYLTFFFIFSSAYMLSNPGLKKVLLLLPLIVLFTILLINMPFLLPKIKNNVIIAKNDNSSRFGSALSDYDLIYKSPFLGYGRDVKNMYKTSAWDSKKMHRNNGITNFITQWGLILFFLYFANYKISANTICRYFDSNKKLSLIFLISILLLGFSQGLFQYPFFHSLVFLQFAYRHSVYDEAKKRLPQYSDERKDYYLKNV